MQGKLVVASVLAPEITLEKLLSDVNEGNLHRDVSIGPDAESEEG